MVRGWEWDDTLFLGSASYYQRGRLPYAPGLPDVLAEILMLDGRGRLIDVGCGPGTLALSLAHLFGDVVGVFRCHEPHQAVPRAGPTGLPRSTSSWNTRR